MLSIFHLKLHKREGKGKKLDVEKLEKLEKLEEKGNLVKEENTISRIDFVFIMKTYFLLFMGI